MVNTKPYQERESNIMKNHRAGVLVVGLLTTLILGGLLFGILRQFVSSTSSVSSDQGRLFDLQLTLEDVPSGYVQIPSQPVSYDDGNGRQFVFIGAGSESPWVHLVQSVVVFPSITAAHAYFLAEISDLERASLSDSFSPFANNLLSHADVAYTRCDRRVDLVTEPTGSQWRFQYCVALAVYDDTLIYITGNIFPERYMNLDSFGSVLRAVDAKFVDPIVSEKPREP